MSVRPCVRVSLRKSAITFEQLNGLARNFQDPLNSLKVIFVRVARTRRSAESGRDPKKAGFRQIYLLRGFWGREALSHLIKIGTTRRAKCWERNFDFLPTAGENRAGRQGWLGGGPKLWNFNILYKKGPSIYQVPVPGGPEIVLEFQHFL